MNPQDAGMEKHVGCGRRAFVALGIFAFVLFPAISLAEVRRDRLAYRGFAIDLSAVGGTISDEVMASLKHQIDIVADCGAKPEIIRFFQRQVIAVKPGADNGGGHFVGALPEVAMDDIAQAPEQPVLLHEMLHAFHFRVLPGGYRNADILQFYENAVRGHRYKPDAYVLKDPLEFFAVTASLYLWGHVDRAPFTRENLRAQQPFYYEWLGALFGVDK